MSAIAAATRRGVIAFPASAPCARRWSSCRPRRSPRRRRARSVRSQVGRWPWSSRRSRRAPTRSCRPAVPARRCSGPPEPSARHRRPSDRHAGCSGLRPKPPVPRPLTTASSFVRTSRTPTPEPGSAASRTTEVAESACRTRPDETVAVGHRLPDRDAAARAGVHGDRPLEAVAGAERDHPGRDDREVAGVGGQLQPVEPSAGRRVGLLLSQLLLELRVLVLQSGDLARGCWKHRARPGRSGEPVRRRNRCRGTANRAGPERHRARRADRRRTGRG